MQKHSVVSSPQSAVNVKTLVTPRGLSLWLVESYAVPLISLEFAFRGGSSQDPADKAGMGTLLASLLDEGAGDLEAFARQAFPAEAWRDGVLRPEEVSPPNFVQFHFGKKTHTPPVIS